MPESPILLAQKKRTFQILLNFLVKLMVKLIASSTNSRLISFSSARGGRCFCRRPSRPERPWLRVPGRRPSRDGCHGSTCRRRGASCVDSKSIPIPSGKHTKNYGKSPCLMGKSTIAMAIFNSNLLVYWRVSIHTSRVGEYCYIWINGILLDIGIPLIIMGVPR